MTDSARKILLSVAWICQESFIDSWINCTPCCETIIKTSRFPSLFLSHTKGKCEAIERWFMLSRRYAWSLCMVGMHGRYFRCWWLTPLLAKQMKSIFALSHTKSTAVLLLDSRIWIPLGNRLFEVFPENHQPIFGKLQNLKKVLQMNLVLIFLLIHSLV